MEALGEHLFDGLSITPPQHLPTVGSTHETRPVLSVKTVYVYLVQAMFGNQVQKFFNLFFAWWSDITAFDIVLYHLEIRGTFMFIGIIIQKLMGTGL